MADLADRFAHGLAHHEAGRLSQARTLYRDVLARDPNHAESLHLLGLLTAQSGDPENGAAMIRQAISRAPGHAPHYNSLAAALRLLGRGDDAVAAYRTAARLRPESAEIHNNLGTTLRELGRQQEAVAEYRLAASRGPEIAEIWSNLASALAEYQQAEDVEDCFRRAIELNAGFVPAQFNYGRWLIGQTRWAEAVTVLLAAVRLAPADARSWNNLGIAYQEAGGARDAEASYRRAIAIEPTIADAWFNLGCLLSGDGRPDDAVRCHEAAIAADPSHGAARLALCMAQLPILYHDEAEVHDRRDRYLAALRELTEATEVPAVARSVAAAFGTSQPFFLPYQELNDREPQAAYGQLMCRLLAGSERRSQLAARPPKGSRIRLGIVSGFFQDHTIFRLFLEGWLTELDRERFDVTAFHTGAAPDTETARAARSCDRFVQGVRSATAWRDLIERTHPHVLLYPEVGMDPVAMRLAAQRLAPVQCVAWGHPETTGMPTIDAFLSADLMEPPDGATHYTERLVRLPRLGLHYTPECGAEPLPRRFGTEPVYWSGQALYKYHPKYDHVFPRIAAAVGACRFQFIGFAKSDAVTAMFFERLTRAFAAYGLDANRYCEILPPMPQREFITAVGLADVILDTPGWSGGRSTMDCLVHSPAIVTLPGPYMRGRHTAAILRRIGCEGTLACSLDDYVSIAIRAGLDTEFRARVRLAVDKGKHRAFRDTGPIRALETFLTESVDAL